MQALTQVSQQPNEVGTIITCIYTDVETGAQIKPNN